MSIRVSWDCYEVALLFAAYARVASGSDINAEAHQLSKTLRELAIRRGISIDDTYRNLNGMKMQLANVQYLFTAGEKGLSGASSMIRQMYELSKINPAEYQMILKEATQMTGNITTSVEDAFFAYAKGKTSLPPAMLADCLRKAADYCHLKQPLLGMTDVKVVRNVQQKVAEGKLLRFRFGKDAQIIRNVTRLYYVFIKSYRESKDESVSRPALSVMPNVAEQSSRDAVNAPKSKNSAFGLSNKTEELDVTPKAGVVDFSTKADYSFTTPYSVSYFGNVFATTSWQQVYMTILTCLFNDYPDQAEKLKGKTTKGGRRILFGDETQAAVMLAAKSVDHTGIYADTNFSATSLVKLMSVLLNYFRVDTANVIVKYHNAKNRGIESEALPTSNESSVDIQANMRPVRQPGHPVDYICSVSKQAAFRQWMQENGISDKTSAIYSTALNQCSQFAMQKGYSPVEFYQMTSGEAVLACKERLLTNAEFAEKNTRRSNQFSAAMTKYFLFVQATDTGETKQSIATNQPEKTVDPRWKEILEKDFPDGYILNDFLCQLQAAGMWQEHFGEPCPLEGEAIDRAISACGTIKDGHIFIRNDNEGMLLAEIADLVADTLKTYSNIYTSQVYQRYQKALASLSIFTENVMVQQVMQYAAGRFNYTYSHLFTKPGEAAIVEVDCERVLQKHGGMMTTDEVADELWFIPRDKVCHYLSTNTEILSLGTGQWVLAEHFPFSREDAELVAKMLDERFLSQKYIISRDIPELLRQDLPFIAENVSSLSFTGLFNIILYYLKDRYDFTRSIVTPLGAKIDFSMLFNAYAREHERFSIEDLDTYAKELHVPIYWESTYAGGAIRVSQDEFVNRSRVHFDVYAIDRVLESICSGDYMSFQAVPNGMLVLLPACGYQWNRYLLQSYVYGFSKVFRMSYSSFAKGGCYGAIVRRDCTSIDSYEKLIERVLTDDDTWTTQTDVLNLVVQRGYQAVRKFNGIENIMAQAKRNKINDRR